MTDKIKRIRLIAILPVICFSIIMCDEDSGNFTMGEEYIESQTDLVMVDTFSVRLSTVILDSVATSGTGTALIGNYADDVTGKISSKSYFQIGIPADISYETDDVYDSINLVIKYNEYSFGDTTVSQKIYVHRLTEDINTDDDVLTANSSFIYDPNPIGSIEYFPSPLSSRDSLLIQINKTLGAELFAMIQNESETFDDDDSFIDYFHGLVLVADDASKGAVIGFSATSSDLKLVLYVTRAGEYSTETVRYEFGMYSTDTQFNQIDYDLASTPLSSLREQETELRSSSTGDLAYIQGGIGLVIRVDFPSAAQILMLERTTLVKAQLCITQAQNAGNDIDYSTSLVLYSSNEYNEIESGVTTSSVSVTGETYEEETIYSFDVTSYLNNELSDFYYNTDESGLLVLYSSSAFYSTFERLAIDSRSQTTRLKLYFLTY